MIICIDTENLEKAKTYGISGFEMGWDKCLDAVIKSGVSLTKVLDDVSKERKVTNSIHYKKEMLW